MNGRPAAAVGIRLEPGANALATADAVRAKVKQLSASSPPVCASTFPYDSTEFISASIHEVVKTLIEAIIMVFLIIYFFLQNLRTAFIPTIVVPVALLGSFAIMYASRIFHQRADAVRPGRSPSASWWTTPSW